MSLLDSLHPALRDEGRHPVAALVERLGVELDTVMFDHGLWGRPASELAQMLGSLTTLVARVTELQLRVVAAADHQGVGQAQGARSTADWWAHHTRTSRPAAHRLMRLARRLDHDRGPVRDAMAAGVVSLEQAHVIVAALDALPVESVDPEIIDKVEAYLIGCAREHDPVALKILGARALCVIAPEVGEAHEQQILDREEREAAAAARLTMSADGHGRVHGRFTLPEAQAQMLKKHLLALTAPKATAGADAGVGGQDAAHPRPLPERMGRALMAWIERYPVDRLPSSGGVAAAVIVTIDLHALLSGLGVATLDTGAVITAAQARRLACEAGIIPAVLGGQSQVLDLGRRTRFHTEVQRVAITIRDKTCTTIGCDWPPGLCQVHHDTPWSQGGGTSVTHGRLLCARHHTLAHDPTYLMTHHPTGKVSFTRRT